MTTFKLWIGGSEETWWCPFGLLETFPWKHDSGCLWSKYFATGWDRTLKMNKGFNNTLLLRVCRNRATDYEMLLFQIAMQNDPHFAETVRRLQLDWIVDDKPATSLERLRCANRRLNAGQKLPPWGDPLIAGDRRPPRLHPCQCNLSRERVPWNSSVYWEGASAELRNALAKRVVRPDAPEAQIISQRPQAIDPPQGSIVRNRSDELRALVRAAAGSTDRREKCSRLMKESVADQDMYPTDLIHLVATGEATTDQKRLFKYNVLRNSAFRTEIYYQQKTYRLNEAFSDERRLLTAYEHSLVDATGLPRAQRAQAGGDSSRRSANSRSAAPIGGVVAQRTVPALTGSTAPTGSAASHRTSIAPRDTTTSGESAAPPRSVLAPRDSTPHKDYEVPKANTVPRAGAVPGAGAVTGASTIPRASTVSRTAIGQCQAERGSPSQPPPFPAIPRRVARRLFCPQNTDFDGFPTHEHVSSVREGPGSQTHEPADIIDLVVENTATMDQLDLFEKRVLEDKEFKAGIVDRLRLLRQRSAIDEVNRLVKVLNRIAIHNLFQV